MYSLKSFGAMVTDDVRMTAYARALEAAIRPGATVVDIGAGTGVVSLIACRLGAAKVYAVEPNPAVEIARECARANGFEDRIVVVQGLSTDLEFDGGADVVVSDLRGILPLWEHHIATVVDARSRLLKPGGTLIPQRDEIHAAVVSAPEDFEEATGPWSDRFGIDLSAARKWTLNSFYKSRFKPEQLLTEPAHVASLDYTTITDPNLRSSLRWTVESAGTGHGVGAWFSTTLLGEIGFSNAPGAPEALYGRAFFPWPEPIALREGDVVEWELGAWLVDDNYVWRWTTRISSGGRDREFDQSTFWSWPLDRGYLERGSSAFVPMRSHEVDADAFVLDRIDGARSLGEISSALQSRFPERFENQAAAMNHVARISRRYG